MYKHAKITIFDDLLAGDFFFHAKGCNLKFPVADSFSFLVEKMQNCLEWQCSPIPFFFSCSGSEKKCQSDPSAGI